MTAFTIKLIIFFICLLSFGCTDLNKNTPVKITKDKFIDSLKLASNRAIILFYVDFLNSKMAFSDEPFINSKTGLDSIFHFIGDTKTDSCFFNLHTIPDGEISFYKDSILITQIQFVLNDTCNGFFSDFTKNPKRYELTTLGDTILLKHKNRTFEKWKDKN